MENSKVDTCNMFQGSSNIIGWTLNITNSLWPVKLLRHVIWLSQSLKKKIEYWKEGGHLLSVLFWCLMHTPVYINRAVDWRLWPVKIYSCFFNFTTSICIHAGTAPAGGPASICTAYIPFNGKFWRVTAKVVMSLINNIQMSLRCWSPSST